MLERRHYKELAALISNHAFASDSERNAFLWNLDRKSTRLNSSH